MPGADTPPTPPPSSRGGGKKYKPKAVTLTDAELDAAHWAQEARRDRLPRVRQVAQDWQVSVATITGLFGAGTLISADTVVRSLDPSGWAILYGALLALALIAAGTAILFASFASHTVWRKVKPTVDAQVELREELIAQARGWLRWSQILTFAAIALLIGAYTVRWYAPQKSPPKSSAVVLVALTQDSSPILHAPSA